MFIWHAITFLIYIDRSCTGFEMKRKTRKSLFTSSFRLIIATGGDGFMANIRNRVPQARSSKSFLVFYACL